MTSKDRTAICVTVVFLAAFVSTAFLQPPKPEETCQVRLREVGRAVLLYAEEHDSYVPPFLTDRVMSEDENQQVPGKPEAWVEALTPFVKEPKAFFCPSAKLTNGKIEDNPRWKWTTYCTTGYIEKPENFGPGDSFRMSLSEVSNPAVSYAQDLLMPDVENLAPDRMVSPHGPKMTVLFYDGSVKHISIQDE